MDNMAYSATGLQSIKYGGRVGFVYFSINIAMLNSLICASTNFLIFKNYRSKVQALI